VKPTLLRFSNRFIMALVRKSFFTRRSSGVYLASMAYRSLVTVLRLVSLNSITLLSLSGCSTLTPDAPRTPEAAEKTVFGVMSSFYCSEKRWPQSWDEVIAYDKLSEEGHHAVGEMISPQLSNPRALILVVRYKNMQGIDRKVTYIAPPECGEGDPAFVSMMGGRVRFKRPEGFEPLKGSEIKAKWKDGPYPDVAWQDPAKSIFVTVSFGEVAVEPSDLESLKGELEAAYEGSLPGLVWIEKSLAGDEEPPKLIHMISSGTAGGKSLSYTMSMSFDGRLLTIGVLGPASRQKEVEELGNSLRRSLKLR
jgi:hypothetical protein